MARFTVRGEVVSFGENQRNVRVHNEEELRRFWTEENIDTVLDWAGEGPPLVTVSAQQFVARCNPGDTVEYVIETWERADGTRVRGIDLQVVTPSA